MLIMDNRPVGPAILAAAGGTRWKAGPQPEKLPHAGDRGFLIRLSSAERVGSCFLYGLSEHLVMPFEALDVIR